MFTARCEPNLYVNVSLITFFKGLSKARKFVRVMLKIFIFQVKTRDQVKGLVKIRQQNDLEELDPDPKEDYDSSDVD